MLINNIWHAFKELTRRRLQDIFDKKEPSGEII